MLVIALAEQIQLVPDGSLLIHIIMILVMIWILNRTFFRPINKIIETRVKNKGGQSSEAEGILKEAAEKREEYTNALQETRSEGYELIEQERSKAVADKQSKVDRAKAEIAQKLETENAELENKISDAKQTIGQEAEKMAEEIRSNILDAA